MLHVRRRALIALFGAGLALSATVGSTAAVTPTPAGSYSISFCYSASDNNIYIHQVWSGITVDTATFGIGRRNGQGFGGLTPYDPAVTSGDETDNLLADPHAYIVGGDIRYNSAVVDSGSVQKVHGSWAKSMPAC